MAKEFACPDCGGFAFGRDTAKTDSGVASLLGVRCNTDGCGWRGLWDESSPPKTVVYEVNADENRSYSSHSPRNVADVAACWKRQGYRPQAYVIIVGDQIKTQEVLVTTVQETADALSCQRRQILP